VGIGSDAVIQRIECFLFYHIGEVQPVEKLVTGVRLHLVVLLAKWNRQAVSGEHGSHFAPARDMPLGGCSVDLAFRSKGGQKEVSMYEVDMLVGWTEIVQSAPCPPSMVKSSKFISHRRLCNIT
jgi:hypothetical protein